jgi:branched-chain amino acid transport system permease protein
LGSGLAGVAGIVRAYDIGLEPVVGLQLAIIAAVGVIIGGIGSMPGAAVGGLALGLTQTLAAIMFGGQWGQPVAFMMLLVIILFRPYGLLGTREHRELRRLL